jgi:diaminohydroxyphosphoribosylaminopyrimidine deaminase/5-amino-6-(5-phosphoribosylamino)uracil reductase
VHQLRAQADMILVGRGTYEADQPSLDVRLPWARASQPAPGVADPRRPEWRVDPARLAAGHSRAP